MDTIFTASSANFRGPLPRARSTSTKDTFKSDSSPEFSMSPTEISSTTSLMASTGMSPQKDEKELSDYHTVLSLLTNNPPEQRLDYLKLEECWSKIRSARNISEDQKHHNTAAEIVTVATVPRALHETAAVELGHMILDSARKYLSSHVADASLSKKQADGTIMYENDNAMTKVMISIEVRYSENYTALCRDKDAWIDRQHVEVCILVCLNESPRFRNPRTRNENVRDVNVEMEAMRRATSQGYYGCIEYRGHKSVGDLHTAFIEPIRYVTSDSTLPKTIGLKVRDFIPDEDWEAANILDGSLSFDGDLYVRVVRRSMVGTANQRYKEFIRS
ncbi:hypothetical protein V1527DRAFT_494427 [Lipomyces starkeyi]